MEDEKDIKGLLLEHKWEASFYQIVEQYSERLMVCALGILGDYAAAQDAVQEAFVSIWNNLHKYKGESTPFTWCYSIVRNQSIRDWKKQQRRGHALPLESAEHQAAGEDLGWDAERIGDQLQRAIDRLPDAQKVVFEMRYFQELSFEEMHGLLGTSIGGLKANYHHARKKIEARLTFQLNELKPGDSN